MLLTQPLLPSGSLGVELHGGKASAELFDVQKKYVFGFHHHGLYPLGTCREEGSDRGGCSAGCGAACWPGGEFGACS